MSLRDLGDIDGHKKVEFDDVIDCFILPKVLISPVHLELVLPSKGMWFGTVTLHRSDIQNIGDTIIPYMFQGKWGQGIANYDPIPIHPPLIGDSFTITGIRGSAPVYRPGQTENSSAATKLSEIGGHAIVSGRFTIRIFNPRFFLLDEQDGYVLRWYFDSIIISYSDTAIGLIV
jgi:hypothetical protein